MNSKEIPQRSFLAACFVQYCFRAGRSEHREAITRILPSGELTRSKER